MSTVLGGRADVAVAGATSATALVALLLRRMSREFESAGALSASTTVGMYAGYAGHAAVTALAAREQLGTLRISSGVATAAGGLLVVGGTGLCLAGMSRFAGPRQISGTQIGGLVTGGIYQYTRNPQYVGYVGLLAGVGVARRSTVVLALAGSVGLVFGWWVPVEERHLEREFGEEYRRYRDQVPRWLGRRFTRRSARRHLRVVT